MNFFHDERLSPELYVRIVRRALERGPMIVGPESLRWISNRLGISTCRINESLRLLEVRAEAGWQVAYGSYGAIWSLNEDASRLLERMSDHRFRQLRMMLERLHGCLRVEMTERERERHLAEVEGLLKAMG